MASVTSPQPGTNDSTDAAAAANDGSVASELRQVLEELHEDEQRVKKIKDLIAQASRVQEAVIANCTDARKAKLAAISKRVAAEEPGGAAFTYTPTPDNGAAASTSGPLTQQLHEALKISNECRQVMPSTGSLFVRFFLGRVNVRVMHEVDRTRLRDEYNKFKDRTNLAFCLLPIMNLLVFYKLALVWLDVTWVYALVHIWLLYYYISLALRENILRVNGSNIRPWWIYHHYLSAVMVIIILTWPNTHNYNHEFLPQFNVYCFCQGVVQLMQAQYQKKRLYIRKSLGKARHMDVNQTETLVETPKEFYLLLLFVYAIHLFQIYNGLSLGYALYTKFHFEQPWYNYREEVQALLVAAIFFTLGVINLQQTTLVIRDKRRKTAKRRALSSRAKRHAS